MVVFVTCTRKAARWFLAEQWEKDDCSRHCDNGKRIEHFDQSTILFLLRSAGNEHARPACQRDVATLSVPRRDANAQASNVPPSGKRPAGSSEHVRREWLEMTQAAVGKPADPSPHRLGAPCRLVHDRTSARGEWCGQAISIDCTAKPMLTKPPIALIAALVLFTASSALAQSRRQAPHPQRRAVETRSAPVLTNPRNAGQAAQDCSSTYQGYRLCDWLRPSPWP